MPPTPSDRLPRRWAAGCQTRCRFLPALLARRSLIAVAGTHGKSTTTAMIIKVLREAAIDCGYIVGTTLPGYGSGSAGSSPFFVLEADEYDRMFLGLNPTCAAITNVEWDHPDCYPTPSQLPARLHAVCGSRGPQRHGGLLRRRPGRRVGARLQLVARPELDHLRRGARRRPARRQPAPRSPAAAPRPIWCGGMPRRDADLQRAGGTQCAQCPGGAGGGILVRHSVRLAVPSLEGFDGTARRFEHKGEAGGVSVYDDYAHHPTEIEATLSAARRRIPERRIWAVFQPHTFSRTRHMLYRMGDSFEDADQVIVTDIYAAREANDGSVSAAELVAASGHPQIRHIGTLDAAAASYLAETLEPGDVLMTLGAGDGYRVGEMVLEQRKANLLHGKDGYNGIDTTTGCGCSNLSFP